MNHSSSGPPPSDDTPAPAAAATSTTDHDHAPAPARSSTTAELATPTTAGAAELARLTIALRAALRQFPDFPTPGVLFEDLLPIFANPSLHEGLLRALHLRLDRQELGRVDVVLGLEARGFLFGPSLALRLGAGFVPVRKKGKLPGPTERVSFRKEYGIDEFEMQEGAIKPGQSVLVVDDIIATGGTAAAAGVLVQRAHGRLLAYLFILELDFLNGRAQLDAPVYTLLASQPNGDAVVG
ncbi:MAG: adenine phosphoribosyltransferase [Phylliscum demangeonii]|nr:MAG: adenine phosphoribosyltransferase [Phylliscum demangeonii]